MWTRTIIAAFILGLGTLALSWLDYMRMARLDWSDITLFIIASGFLALGLYLGKRLFAPQKVTAPTGNPQVVDRLGISARELMVLQQLAAGHSNKEIARKLDVSPNTIKTHIARLYEKLEARRRTEAVLRARELGIIA